MPRDGQTRLGWDRFDGGIEQAPERAQPGQVLDARNIWAPDGLPERRPGSRFIVGAADIDHVNPTDVTVDIVDLGNGTFEYTVTIVAGFATSPPADALMSFLSMPLVGDAFEGPFIALTQVSGPSIDTLVSDVDRVYRGTWNTNTASVRNNVRYYFTGRAVPFLLAEVSLAGGKRLLMVYEWRQNSTGNWQATIDVPPSFGLVRSSYDLTTDLAIAGLPQASSRISTYVELPGLDRVLVTYNRIIYEIGPGLGEIAEAVVNTDPDFVGPRTVDADGNYVTPTYSVDVLAQLSAPPRAGILVYFVGHIFALDILGEEFNVRWTAAVPLGGYNVWPLVNFEPLDEDGGRPIGAKPLHEFLVVYQPQNIYILINDGADTITGQATFDPKRVVSGVGALSHNGIVEVQGRHMFPALDGFYAFDGTPNVVKLSTRIDKFYRRLGASNLTQTRGVHWPEKHCVLWTIPQSGAANPRELNETQNYIILFDYVANEGKGAWWIWDGVRGGGGLARLFAGDVVPSAYFMSSLATVYKLTGNADIVDQNAITIGDLRPVISDLPAAYILTHRLGEPAYTVMTAEDVWVEADTHASDVGVTIIPTDDTDVLSLDRTINMTNENDVLWGDTTWGGSKWRKNKRREQYQGTRAQGKHMQLKIYAVNALNRAWRFIRAALFVEKLQRRG